jgi:hypothetical protein
MSNLEKHLQTKEENRNQNWDEVFFKLISESYLKILSEDPQQGPDGWPYLMTETVFDQSEQHEMRTDSVQKILNWLSTRGIGLVVNPMRTPYPDYVFSYGMIWSFRETGYFIKYSDTTLDKKFELNAEQKIFTGPPSLQYWPNYARQVVKDFFRDQNVFEPKVLMISVDQINYDLCFSLESLGNPPEVEHEGILEALSWFFPPNYSLAVVSEKSIQGFEAL